MICCHIHQSFCTNCFLALLFLYLFVKEGRLLDAGLLQFEVFAYSVNLFDLYMAVDYHEFLAVQLDIRLQVAKMYLVLEFFLLYTSFYVFCVRRW